MADGTGFTVRPDELSAAGSNAQAVAGKVPEETARLAAPSDRAAAGLAGWQSGPALRECSAAWRTLLDGLAEDMKAAGGNLIATAHNYRDSDRSMAGTGVAQGGGDPFNTEVRQSTGVHAID
ncbi:type VII secretion target [Kitasatospora sp. NPDC127111]|uniref:type VII secretion target n=1 Tax=Kitasatospora sp. NPDC127111 TaxID=3345363 RepID=UPI003633A392